MNNTGHDNLDHESIDNGRERNILPGIVAVLGKLKLGAIVTEELEHAAKEAERTLRRIGELSSRPPPYTKVK
jgi:hypothetical protein